MSFVLPARSGANGQVTVTDAATLISPGEQRTLLSVFNNSADVIVYVGLSAAVTVDDGMPIAAGAERVIACEGAVYAIVDSGLTADVRWFEERF